MSEGKNILENAVDQLTKANLDREKAVKLQIDSLNKALEVLSGDDKIKFQGVKGQIEGLLDMVRKGGDAGLIVESLKNIKF